MKKLLMIQGTSSGAGKSTFVIAICRILSDMGYSVAPFKAQNMSSNIFHINKTRVIAHIQAVQALACRTLPKVEMNPILLRPLGNYYSEVFINGEFLSKMHARDYYESYVLNQGFNVVIECLEKLAHNNDFIVIEGAGSPAEINIIKYDISNMILADKFHIPVLLIADIERGGCFASIFGTIQLLPSKYRSLIKGVIINKFLGDKEILKPAIDVIEKRINKRILGTIPKIKFDLPPEDSLDLQNNSLMESTLVDLNINLLANAVKENLNIPEILKIIGED